MIKIRNYIKYTFKKVNFLKVDRIANVLVRKYLGKKMSWRGNVSESRCLREKTSIVITDT